MAATYKTAGSLAKTTAGSLSFLQTGSSSMIPICLENWNSKLSFVVVVFFFFLTK
jgi:hypothetical protein